LNDAIVKEKLRKRTRYTLELSVIDEDRNGWNADLAVSNRCEGGKETVDFHSDRLSDILSYARTASLSRGMTTGLFSYDKYPHGDSRNHAFIPSA
jgi:hypothetical protein